MRETYVIEESEAPVVFSDSPDSPAAEFLVEKTPRSIRDLYEFGIIHPSVPEDDLRDIENALKHITVPDVLLADDESVVSAREIEGVVTTPHEVAIMREAVSRATSMLVARGHSPKIAELTAAKAARFISPIRDTTPVWREIHMADLNLEVRGLLYIKRSINSLWALDVIFHPFGWIIPEGSHFLLTCNEMVGRRPSPLDIPLVAQELTKPGPRPPIDGVTPRLPVGEIKARAQAAAAGWR